MPSRDQMWGPMSLEDYAEKFGEDLSQRPVDLDGLGVMPELAPVHGARGGDSISSIMGSSDPAAIGAFMTANGLTDSRIRAGADYMVPQTVNGEGRAMGQAALNADNARLAKARTILPGDAVTVRPGATVFDGQKGILATRPAAGGLLSQGARTKNSGGFGAASDIFGHMGRFIEGQEGVVKAVIDGGKEMLGATDEQGAAKRVLRGLRGANIGLTVAEESLGLADDLKRGVPARVAVPGAVMHGAASLGAGAMGTAAGAVAGQILIPIPGVGAALGGAAGGILAGWAADKFGPTREHFGWELEKMRKTGRGK